MPYLRVKNELPLIPGYASGDIASFFDGYPGAPINDIKVNISADPGITSLNVALSGANVWNESWESGSIIPSTGEDVANANKIRCVGRIPVKPDTSYVIVFSGVTSGSDYIYYYKKDGTFISSESYIHTENGTKVFTTPSDCYWIRFIMSQSSYNNNISVNYPSTDTEYHAYSGENHDIALGRTVTDGWLDVTNGKLHIGNDIYDVIPESFEGISGTNYIYSTGGDVEVKYIRRLDS